MYFSNTATKNATKVRPTRHLSDLQTMGHKKV